MSAIIIKLNWLQKMYNYLYSRVTGSIRTINGESPDDQGNIEIPIGGNLQAITNVGNVTTNAIQVTGLDGLDTEVDTAFMIKAPDSAQFGGLFAGGTESSIVSFNDDGTFAIGKPSGYTLTSSGLDTPFTFKNNASLERVSGAPGTQDEDFVTLGQLNAILAALPTP